MISFPAEWSALRVILCHDWLNGMRGGERVLEWLCRGFPSAPIYTLLHEPQKISRAINEHPIRVSGLQRIPGFTRGYRYFLPLFPAAIERFRLPEADLVISTSHCVAKGIRPPPGARHLCYCFTPMRYAWVFPDEYFGRGGLKRRLIEPWLAYLREWDRASSERVDHFVTLSHHVRARIRLFYGRDAAVVYPPVDIDFFTPAAVEPGGFDLIVSALVPYKRLDVAVRAYRRLGYPLKIVGTGTEYARLRREAAPCVEFLGWRSDEEVRDLYRRCRFLIFPGEEDFGLVPLEAQACGRPVIAYGRGGARESVVEGISGVFFHEQTEDALLAAIEEAAAKRWDPAAIRAQAERFSPSAFIEGMAREIRACLENRSA